MKQKLTPRGMMFLVTTIAAVTLGGVHTVSQVRSASPAAQTPSQQGQGSKPTTRQSIPRAKVLLRDADGRIWEVNPGISEAADKCERPAGFAGLNAGTIGGRCTYLTCRWLVELAECIEKFADNVPGNECTDEDYKEIKMTQDEASLACAQLAFK